MSRDELIQMFDAGDLYGLLLGVGRAWLAKHHPDSEYAVVLAELAPGIPPVQVTITPASVAA